MFSRWDPANNCYVRYGELESDGSDHGDPADVAPGLGYWLIQDVDDNGFIQIDDDQIEGMLADDALHEVSLNTPSSDPVYRGLTMLANPFMVPLTVADCYVQYNGSATNTPLATAVSSGNLNANIYTWNPETSEYETQLISEAVLDPWEGFWIETYYTLGTIDFEFAPGGYFDGGWKNDETEEVADLDSWTLQLPVRSVDGAYSDSYNSIGISSTSNDAFDPWDASEFTPMGSRIVQMYFEHQEWESLGKLFTNDIRAEDFEPGSEKVWEATVRTWRLPNRTFEMRWPTIDEISDDFSFILEADVDGEPVELDMRAHDHYRFTTGDFTGNYDYQHITIHVCYQGFDTESDPASDLLPDRYAFEPAFPNPFNPTTILTIALPEASDLNVRVYNLMGQQVATLARGRYSAGYQQILFNGSELASGVYLVHAEVPGELSVSRKVLLLK